jgi:hypothetical protein
MNRIFQLDWLFPANHLRFASNSHSLLLAARRWIAVSTRSRKLDHPSVVGVPLVSPSF